MDNWELLNKRIEEDVSPSNQFLGKLLLDLKDRVEKLEGWYQEFVNEKKKFFAKWAAYSPGKGDEKVNDIAPGTETEEEKNESHSTNESS